MKGADMRRSTLAGFALFVGMLVLITTLVRADIAARNVYKRDGTAHVIHYYNNLGTTADGYWIESHGFDEVSLNVTGIDTATFQVRGSNDDFTPIANSSDGFQIGSNITADGATTVTAVPRFIKVICSVYTSSTALNGIDVYMLGK